MAGFLDLFNDDQAMLGLGLLAAAGPSATPQSAFQRVFGAVNDFQGRKAAQEDRMARRGLLDAQLDETRAQAAQRRGQAARDQQLMERNARIGEELRGLDQQTNTGMRTPSAVNVPFLDSIPMFSQAGMPSPPAWATQHASTNERPSMPEELRNVPFFAEMQSPASRTPMPMPDFSGLPTRGQGPQGGQMSPSAPANGQDALPNRLVAQANVFARHGDIDSANKLYERAAQFMPSVHNVEVMMQGDQPVTVVTYKNGRQEVSPFAPEPKTRYVDTGGQIIPTDERTQRQLGASFAKTMTPGEAAGNRVALGNLAVAQGNLGLSRERLAMEQNAPQYLQTEQGYVAVPKRPGPGPIAGQAVMGPNGETLGPPLKQIPASANTAIATNLQNLKRATDALALVQGRNVGSATGDTAATGWKGYLPQAVLNRQDPSGVDTRAAIADLGSLVIHDRSGAAVTAAEFPRLAPFIPSPTDNRATVEKKLKRFVEVYQQEVNSMADTYSREQGYRPNPALQRGAAGSQSSGGASGSWDAPNLLPELPKANGSNRGKLIKDHATGKTLRSDGFQWKEIQ